MSGIKFQCVLILVILLSPLLCCSQIDIGAQVYIEPGQTKSQIEHWFKTLKDHGMSVCRIRMDETHMKTDDGYDFTLYDLAFDAAEKNDIKVFATIFPAEEDAKGVGGFKFPVSDLHQKQIANFIAALVNNFKDHSALEVWVLQNEPGVGHIPETSFSQNKFATWKEQVKDRPYNGYIRKHQYESEFLFQYTTWYLNWIGQEIRKYDSKTKFHVNNHMIFQLLPEYDFPSWEDFLDHLGASMHPSWHFGYFERDEYPLAISANCNLIRNGAGDNPFWVTELQAGNNNYSGFDPMMPTPDEIQQWMLTSVFGGTEGIIFWTLNSRSVGFEAGEWALIDYQNAPTRRLKAAAEVTKLIQDYPDLAKAKPVTSDVHILFSRPSMSYQKNSEMDASLMRRTYDARSKGGHIKSVLGYYQALLTQGITADISGLEEFDWAVEKGTVILPNMVIIPRKFYRPIKDFVNRGGTLLLSGQSGHLDEYQYNVLQDEDWELAEVLGAKMQEFRAVADRFQVTEQLTGHYLQGTLSIDAAKPLIENEQGEILASTNSFGNGKAIWIPSMVGLGARKFDPIALGTYCAEVLGLTTAEVGDPKVLFQQLASEKYTYKLIINTSEELFPANMLGKKEEVLFKSRFNSATGNLDKDGMLVFRTKNSSFTCIVIPPN